MKSQDEILIKDFTRRIEKYEKSLEGSDLSKSKVPVNLGGGFTYLSAEAMKMPEVQKALANAVYVKTDGIA